MTNLTYVRDVASRGGPVTAGERPVVSGIDPPPPV